MRNFMSDPALQTTLKSGDWRLVGIGMGDNRALKSWARLAMFPGKMYADAKQPSLPVFKALGANFKGEMNCKDVTRQACVGTYHGISVVWCRGYGDLTAGLLRNNFVVQGGVVAFDGGKTVFSRHMARIDEPLPAAELAAALGTAPAAQIIYN